MGAKEDVEKGEDSGQEEITEPLIEQRNGSKDQIHKSTKEHEWMVYLSTFVAVCGAYEFGCCVGYSSPIESAITEDLDLSLSEINIWSYSTRRLLHSIETGHSTNIFCTKFMSETSDELVASGAGDAEVRLFNLSHIGGRGSEETAISPLALFQCHTSRVKKLAVEAGNPNVVWSASEDGTLRQHDLRECASCPPAGSSHQECRNVLAARYDDLEDVISFVSAGISLDSKDSQGRTSYD